VLLGPRASTDLEGFITLINAAYSAGELEVARGLANFWTTKPHPVNQDWWQDANWACAKVVEGDRTEALDRFSEIRESARLPVRPILLDSPCLKALAEDPVYQEILEWVEAKRTTLRERLPATLADFDVSL
jgi:hypothetical protein